MDSPTFYWVGAAISACALWRFGVQAWPPPEFVEGSGAPTYRRQAQGGSPTFSWD
jgi:hypothetical protein